MDTIQEKIYRISNLTIFEYNIFEKISASKLQIQYFPKNIMLENLDTIQKKIYRIYNLTIFEYNIFEKNISLENSDTIFSKKYQARKCGYNKKIVVSYSVKLP